MFEKLRTRFRRRKTYLDATHAKNLEAFAVEQDNPMLKAVEFMTVQREEAAIDFLRGSKLSDSETHWHGGYLACARELQERIDQYVVDGNKAKLSGEIPAEPAA